MESHPALTHAYREYLDRMIEQSDDLVLVDVFSIPEHIDPDSSTFREWANIV